MSDIQISIFSYIGGMPDTLPEKFSIARRKGWRFFCVLFAKKYYPILAIEKGSWGVLLLEKLEIYKVIFCRKLHILFIYIKGEVLMNNRKYTFVFCVLFIFIGIIFIFASQSYANKTLENSTTKILEDIKNETYKKYNIGTYKISSKEISIEIIGESEYYNSVKDEIETLIKNIIKSTEFENYSVHINQSKINQVISKKDKEELVLLEEVYTNLNILLTKSYSKQIDRITINNNQELFVKVETKLNKKQKSINIGKEIEREIYTFFEENPEEFIMGKPIKIYIYNKYGKKIN